MARTPFRDLVVASPLTKGWDVLLVQKAINRLHDEYELPKVSLDSHFGRATLGDKRVGEHKPGSGARGCLYYLGAADRQINHGFPVSKHGQTILRAPWRRYPAERIRGRKRYIARRKELQASRGPRAALVWAHKQFNDGVKENPPGSNTGPRIDTWTRRFGCYHQSWCGAFAGYALLVAGLNPSYHIRYIPSWPDLYPRVPWDSRQPGDLIAINRHSHGGILDYDRRHTIEGNTDSDGGASGGRVMRHLRPLSQISAVYRPRW